jgi:hypothetical protein
LALSTPGGGSVRLPQLSRLDVAAPYLNCRVKVRVFGPWSLVFGQGQGQGQGQDQGQGGQ